MKKWNLIVDVAECHGCHNCVVASKDELVGNAFPGYTAPHAAHGPGVVRIERTVRGSGHHVTAAHLPRLCNHCDDAPCLAAGADGSVRKRDDGIVIFDPVKARGRRDLVDVCPYGAVVWNEEAQLPQNWFFDAHLLDGGWATPRCVTVCPTRALEAVQLDDAGMQQRAEGEGLRVLRPELGTRPRVYYRHLHRVDRLFIAGSVTTTVAGRNECQPDVEVEVLCETKRLGVAVTDAFGDFRLDGLPAGLGHCRLTLHHPDRQPRSLALTLRDTSLVLDPISMPGLAPAPA